MTTGTALRILLIAGGLLIATAFVVISLEPQSNQGFKDAAAALTFVSAAALGIERTIELFWTVIGAWKGSYWPLAPIHNQVQTLADELDNSLKPFHEQGLEQIEKLKKGLDAADPKLKKLNSAKSDIERLKKRFDELRKLAPGNQRAQLLAAAAKQNVVYLEEKYGNLLVDLNDAASVAKSAIDGIQDFLATFKDNPGRRLISIFAGAILGMLLAGVFGLDIFMATLGTTPDQTLSIILTGVIMGLGSNPTHEVIRIIQEYKEHRKGENTQQPELVSSQTEQKTVAG